MMAFGIDWLAFFTHVNDLLAWPGSVLFLGSAILLSYKTRFVQVRGFGAFLRIITRQTDKEENLQKKLEPSMEVGTTKQTVTPLRALFAALATSIGMGNVIGPSVAIMKGGPGAIFWMVVYMFFGSITKFSEVCFALHTREKLSDGHIIGGPMEYLRKVNPYLSLWYGGIMAVLFASWSGNQSNTLAALYALESVPTWLVGGSLAMLVFVVVRGGAQRVSSLASRLVPIMFFLYVSFAFFILMRDPHALMVAMQLCLYHAFTPTAAIGGFLGASIFTAMRYGAFRGVYVSESGLGTASIPHAMSDAKRPSDQGLLAMGSTVADISLCIVSGLIVLVTGIWMQGSFRTTLVYEVFKIQTPGLGQIVLLVSLTLFVLTTVIGNTFNGIQSFSSLTGHRWVKQYLALTIVIIFAGAFVSVPLIWEILDLLLFMAAVPNLLGVVYLAFKEPDILSID